MPRIKKKSHGYKRRYVKGKKPSKATVSSAKPKKKSHKKHRKSSGNEQLQAVMINITALILVLCIGIMIFSNLNKSTKGINVDIADVQALNMPYATFYNLKELSGKYNIAFNEIITYYAIENNFFQSELVIPEQYQIEQSFIINYEKIKSQYDKSQVEPYLKILSTILDEIKYFPIPTGTNLSEDGYMYGNSWGANRDYGSDRIHMGTDIIDRENIRGKIPIVSMTDGIIEQIGWNEYGGFRVGIRTANDTYYYYAHLDSFENGIEKGMAISAGDLIGTMGDTGYSKKEGTRGNFVVHLHVGISVKSKLSKEELWINPYLFLRNAESYKIELLQ